MSSPSDEFTDKAAHLADTASDKAKDFADKASDKISDVVDDASDKAEKVADAVSSATGDAVKQVKKTFADARGNEVFDDPAGFLRRQLRDRPGVVVAVAAVLAFAIGVSAGKNSAGK
ncbi:hypothetical protein EV379_3413 [Microterricola gilva]|uniref:ElaB/YqjD/DUF883 family membrane-anchored ribosome-binding protein n=1 Tax=Microterricola gilva TaxID=393267 RepID=A0A4Q8AQX8_9MICO|nr:YtxH domain-containing protein [Microterricola gilva]RZU67038.1 hypothetical protein EV379_3413 [Microterricola gilva]